MFHLKKYILSVNAYMGNTMSLVDYPLFSWVVVIHSLHVSSFLEAHHQEIIFTVQSASGIVCNMLL